MILIIVTHKLGDKIETVRVVPYWDHVQEIVDMLRKQYPSELYHILVSSMTSYE